MSIVLKFILGNGADEFVRRTSVRARAARVQMSAPLDFSSITKADLEGVGLGLVSELVRIGDTDIVAKIPCPSPLFPAELYEVEKRIYERVGEHPNILRYLGQSPPKCSILKNALLLEYQPHNIRACIHDLYELSPCYPEFVLPRTPLKEVNSLIAYRLPRQAAGALAHIHSLGIIHADLGLHNLLLSREGNVVFCDFAGSGIDGTRNRVAHGTRYADPLRRYDAI